MSDSTNYGVCKDCRGTMLGDGVTMVRHCEHVQPAQKIEPDAGPLFCGGFTSDGEWFAKDEIPF